MTKNLTVQELSEQWRKPPEWITKQARQGNIPGAWKLGRQWRFNADQIEAYEQSQRAGGAQPPGNAPRTKNIYALTPGALRRRRKKNIS